jgi:hypothetical protein
MARSPLYHVFVSHSTADKRLARTLCAKIEAMGLTTFRDDRDISAGSKIAEEIVAAMRRSGEVVVLVTPVSVTRFWVAMEVGMAVYAGRRLVPVFHRISPDQVPGVLRERRGYDMCDIEAYLKDLRSRYSRGVT